MIEQVSAADSNVDTNSDGESNANNNISDSDESIAQPFVVDNIHTSE